MTRLTEVTLAVTPPRKVKLIGGKTEDSTVPDVRFLLTCAQYERWSASLYLL